MGPPGSSRKDAGKKRQKKWIVPLEKMVVSESLRIRVAEILDKLRSSDEMGELKVLIFRGRMPSVVCVCVRACYYLLNT